MKNAINYYYKLLINDITKKADEYIFFLNNEEYHLIIFNRPLEDVDSIYKLNREMIKNNILVHQIILNKDNSAITFINNKTYVLLKLCSYKNDKIFINDIKYYQTYTMNINYEKDLLRVNWVKMWCDKIDYYEYQISELGKKYPILINSLSYYIGLGENAISYINNKDNYNNIDLIKVVSHKRTHINSGSFEFYNPINFIIDNRVRDISEYIKDSFFNNEFNKHEIKLYLDNINFNEYEYILLFSRLLFPSYYFDIYDEIINNNLPEEEIINIIQKNGQYEEFLREIYNYIRNKKNILLEPINWLIKDTL